MEYYLMTDRKVGILGRTSSSNLSHKISISILRLKVSYVLRYYDYWEFENI